jgi:hypothetical protein
MAATELTVDPGTGWLCGPGWELRARWIRGDPAGQWQALAGLQRGLTLLVAAAQAGVFPVADPDSLWVEAWAGEPDDSDGVAVIGDGQDRPLQLARVPLCSCGDRGCGNANVQLAKEITAAELGPLLTLLRDLPWAEAAPDYDAVLRGDGLAALPA